MPLKEDAPLQHLLDWNALSALILEGDFQRHIIEDVQRAASNRSKALRE